MEKEMNVPQTADIVVAGGGVIGASTAYHLAKGGAKNVVLLERHNLFGTESTAKCAGGVRYHFDTEINARMSLLSLPAFDRFEDETGYSADYRKIGYLFILTKERDVEAFRRQMGMHLSLGIRTEWLSGDEIRRRLPMMSFEDALGGLFARMTAWPTTVRSSKDMFRPRDPDPAGQAPALHDRADARSSSDPRPGRGIGGILHERRFFRPRVHAQPRRRIAAGRGNPPRPGIDAGHFLAEAGPFPDREDAERIQRLLNIRISSSRLNGLIQRQTKRTRGPEL